jgi:hypothetical protein
MNALEVRSLNHLPTWGSALIGTGYPTQAFQAERLGNACSKKAAKAREIILITGKAVGHSANWTSAPRLQRLERMQPLRFSRIPSAQTEALFALPDQVAKVIRNTFPEPVKAAIRMLPGSRHRKSHVYRPYVPIRAAKAYDNQ